MRSSKPDNGLDTLDYKILGALGEHGFMKNTELAELVGLSPSACHARMNRLKKMQILRGFDAVIDISKLAAHVHVLTLLMLERQDIREYRRVNNILRETPEIIRVHRVSGEFDYAFETIATDYDSYRRIVENVMSSISVKQYQSRILQERILERNSFAGVSSLGVAD